MFQTNAPRQRGFTIKPFVISQEDSPDMLSLPNTVQQNQTICRIRLNQHDESHYRFLFDPQLFRKVDEECHIIHIRSNNYFGPMLLLLDAAIEEQKLQQDVYFSQLLINIRNFKLQYQLIFHEIMTNCYPPVGDILTAVHKYKNKFKGKRYLGVHSRGFYDQGPGTEELLDSATLLLENGNFSYVFFATESASLQKIAVKRIPKSVLLMTDHEVVMDLKANLDSLELRDTVEEMQAAMLDLLSVGEADFCMSPTAEKSTFSMAAILSGSCQYISYGKHGLSVLTGEQKENYFAYASHIATDIYRMRDQYIWPLDASERERLWLTIRYIPKQNDKFKSSTFDYGGYTQSELFVTEQCMEPDDPNAIRRYYFGKDFNTTSIS